MLTNDEHRLYKLIKAGLKTWDNLSDEEFKIMAKLNKKCPYMFEE